MTYIVKYRSIPLNIFIHPSCTQRMLLHFKSLHVNAELCTVLSERNDLLHKHQAFII